MVVRTLSHSALPRVKIISSVLGLSLHWRPQFQVTVGLGMVPLITESARMQFMPQWWQFGSMQEPLNSWSVLLLKNAPRTEVTMK